MKRKNLAKLEDERVQVSAKVERFGVVNDHNGKVASMLLSDILVSNGQISEKVDHMWIRINKLEFEGCLNITDKSYISFSALIKTYFLAPDFKKVQGYCFRKVKNIKSKATNVDGITLKEFISFKEEQGVKVRKYA